jgi:hypothetical protein
MRLQKPTRGDYLNNQRPLSGTVRPQRAQRTPWWHAGNHEPLMNLPELYKRLVDALRGTGAAESTPSVWRICG